MRIEPESFKHVPTLKTLDLSHNVLIDLDQKTFAGVSQSLETLIMRKSLQKPGKWKQGLFSGRDQINMISSSYLKMLHVDNSIILQI